MPKYKKYKYARILQKMGLISKKKLGKKALLELADLIKECAIVLEEETISDTELFVIEAIEHTISAFEKLDKADEQ